MVSEIALLADGSLRLAIEPGVRALVEDWLPDLPNAGGGDAQATIAVSAEPAATGPLPAGEPTLRLGEASAWVRAAEERTDLVGGVGGSRGAVLLDERRAELHAGSGDGAVVAAELYGMLTIAAALLLGRLGQALVHAGAVVAPTGAAWLLAGDARSGKSSTVANLIEAGWSYLSDDQVVLTPTGKGGGALQIEGWPRAFHLDVGWERAEATPQRRAIDPSTLGPGRRERTAPLGGLIFPNVDVERPTRLSRIAQSDALARLVRQTPWLLADPAVAQAGLELLASTAQLPAFRLELGRDTYRDSRALLACLTPLSNP